MYDISKRKELKNATVDDVLKILQELPKDSKVFSMEMSMDISIWKKIYQ